jgi:pimeloyl-ACP methyl ester carboxylesterase
LKVVNTIETLNTGACIKFVKISKKKLPTAILVHGWGSSVFREGGSYESLAEVLRDGNYHTLQLALRGHEGAFGDRDTVTRADNEADIKAAFEYIKQQPEVDMDNILACGTSYGGYLLATLADTLPIKNMILRAPALYPDSGWDSPTKESIDSKDLMDWRRKTHQHNEVKALSGINRYTGNLLIISSEFDEDIPDETRQSYLINAIEASSVTEEIIPGATHALHEEKDKEIFRNIVKEWSARHR